jgi:glycosyltransferase involved in cell wall biosynthesis
MIIFYLPNYVPHYNAGDTLMAHAIVKYLQSKGNECIVMLPKEVNYEYDGVKVVSRNTSMLKSADLVICQLDTTVEAIKLNKNIIWIQHNTFPYPTVQKSDAWVIYNGEYSRQVMGWDNEGFILPPPVDYDYYNGERGDCVTLINCNENKGGKVFYEIAKRMPHIKFLQVIGAYGTQYVCRDGNKVIINLNNEAFIHGLGSLPNVEVIEHTEDIRAIYKRTKILLMPSEYESWGRTATEAMCSGIPIICTPTFGLKENCLNSAIFVERNNIEGWMKEIEKLQGKKEYTEASLKSTMRAKELHPKKKLEQLEQWIKKKIYGIQYYC